MSTFDLSSVTKSPTFENVLLKNSFTVHLHLKLKNKIIKLLYGIFNNNRIKCHDNIKLSSAK